MSKNIVSAWLILLASTALCASLAACEPTGKPSDDHHESTPLATPSAISPELTSASPAIIGNLPDVTSLSDFTPGVGGTGELVTNPFDGSVQAVINTARFGVVHAGNAVSVES
ncbi:MAG: hypothetical protein CO064_11855, partial [Anaerolineae bacterium CG_4_9_14_0_8_um_filter_58_9]